MMTHKRLLTSSVAVILGLAMAVSTDAWLDTDRITHLTFSGAVALPGVTLGAGSYTFELVEPGHDIVRVLSRDRSTVYYMGFTRPVQRPAPLAADCFITLGESHAGVAPPITAWYPVGRSMGNQFIYRK